MTQAAHDILQQALQLPAEDRLMIAQELWNSVDPVEAARFYMDDELLAEINRRSAEMDAGMSMTHEEMMASLLDRRGHNS